MSYTTFVVLSTFASVTVVTLVLWIVIYEVFLRYKLDVRERLRRELDQGNAHPALGVLFKDFDDGPNRRFNRDRSVRRRLENLLAQSGLLWTVNGLFGFCLVSSATCAMGVQLAGRHWFFAALAGLGGGAIPLLYVLRQRNKRITAILHQLPHAFTMMSRAVRAGHTVNAAVSLVVDDLGGPVGQEFGTFSQQQGLGMPTDTALRDLARRVSIPEFRMFVVGMLVQARSGGRLSELLDNLAIIARKRLLLREKVKAYTSEGRAQALVLMILPIASFAGLFLFAPDYVRVLLDRPYILLQAGSAQLLGAIWIRHIAAFEY